MTTHYHLLLITEEANLAAGMHVLNGVYARYFNRRHDRRGHLFERRYYGGVIESDPHLLDAIQYIALNPKAAGICSELEQWPWNGYCEATGTTLPRLVTIDDLLGHFGRDRDVAVKRYCEFVERWPLASAP